MVIKASTCIAIVDDDDSVRTALRRLLQASGLSVETFTGGAEFLAALSAIRPDCVLLDLHMPGTSGCDVLAQLARVGANMPVIVITGDPAPDLEESAMRSGATAVLRKPIKDRTLIDTISEVLSRSDSR